MTVTVSARSVTRALLLSWGVLVAAGAGVAVFQLVYPGATPRGFADRFHLDREGNVPTWFSSSILLVAAGLLFLRSRVASASAEAGAFSWLSMSLAFVYVSMDETGQLHELAIVPVRRLLGVAGPLHFAWVIPGAAVVAIAGLAWLRLLLSLDPATRRRLAISAIVFLSGALGLEMVGGWVHDEYTRASGWYVATTVLEEALEMLGVIIFIRALLLHLGERAAAAPIELRFGAPSDHSEAPAGERLPG